MKIKEFLDLGGQIVITQTKVGYVVVVKYTNRTMKGEYTSSSLVCINDSQLEDAKQKAVNECLYSRALFLRAQQTFNIRQGLDNSLPTDVFSGHPGLLTID
jgi:hypothetical protein